MASVVDATAEWHAYSGWNGTRVVGNSQAAVALCEEIEAHDEAGRLLVGFTSVSGRYLAIGLGADASCAVYWESADPPYFQSRGDSPADRLVDFAHSGQHTELPGTVRIPRSDALLALAEFMVSDTLPKCITWEET
jgi:hypothetical protein